MVASTVFVDGLKKGLGALADLVMPPACMLCRTPVTRALSLCADCWSTLPAIGNHCCIQCSTPLPTEWQTESHCLGCLHKPPPFTEARAPYIYDAAARQMVLGFKNGREAWASVLARAMARTAPDWIAPGRLLIPVPLHRWRLASRGYNQAQLLASALCRIGGADLGRDWLIRQRATPSTRGMSRRQRERNVEGAFRIRLAMADRIKGAAITLVDDVMTTGATARACAGQLMQAGAVRVDVLVYARVAAVHDATYLERDPDWEQHDQS